MKKRCFYPAALALLISLGSCAGGWTDDDKKQLRKECAEQVGSQITEARRDKYCDCFVDQMVKTFPVFNDVMEHYQSDTVDALKAHCRKEIGLP